MGGGPSKIDYKERDFTKEPLDDQEIDILLQALPEENVIDSIESEGREKILRAMSDQKVFNIRGDSIFDYYFTNNKENIKGCMTNQFTRDGTPCPDEKFNRMITRIPDLVQGPLGEKETQWNIERTNLQSQYDTLQQKRQQNFETLALDRFLVNPEIYNKMLMEKMSQKALDIFTKDGDIDINVKELFVDHPEINDTLNTAYDRRTAMLLVFVEYLKEQASDLLNKFTKEKADGVKSQMPVLQILIIIVQMKIAVQYSGSEKTKIVPNRTLYNYFSEFFDELGIDQNNIEYTLKFITFNVFKKFMDYNLKNDVKGIDLYLKDFLKLIKEFGGEEYLNSLSDFDVNTDMTFDYVHANISKPDMSVSEKMCRLYMESKNYGFNSIDQKRLQSGCVLSKPYRKGFYNRASTDDKCTDDLLCVQKPPDVKNFLKTSEGNPDFSVSEFECKAYGESIGMWHSANNWSTYQTGCLSNADGKILYNRQTTPHNCEASKQCIKKKPKVDHFQKFTVGKPPSKYKEVTSGKPDWRVSQEECEAYMDSKGYGFEVVHYNIPSGCVVDSRYSPPRGFYNTRVDYVKDCQGDIPCIQKNPESVSKFECEQYANNTDGIEWGADTFTHDQRPKGCQIHPSNKVYFNDDNNNKNTSCSDAYKCILKPMKLTEHRKFKKIKEGSNDMSVSEQQCQAYANNLKKTMKQGNDTSGCYTAPASSGLFDVYYNKETGKGRCYMNSKTDFRMCVQKPLIKEDFKTVSSGKPLSFYKDVSSGKPDMSVSEAECKEYANSIGGSFESYASGWSPAGCIVRWTNTVKYNTQVDDKVNSGTDYGNCGYQTDTTKWRCIQKNPKSVSEQQCKAYADTHGLAFSVHDDTPSSYKRYSNGACYCGTPYGGIDGRYGSITDERRYTGGWATANGYTDEKCKNTCLNKLPESKVVQGCSRLPVSKHRSNKKDVVVYVKNAREEPIKCGSSTTGKCVEKALN